MSARGDIYETYSKALCEARVKYGRSAVVWMEVGSFYEMYAVSEEHVRGGEDRDMSESELRRVCDVLDVTVTKKNKSNPASDMRNPFMAGFPTYMLDRYLDQAISQRYTVVLMEQHKSQVRSGRSPGGSSACGMYRTVTRVVSPGTHVPQVEQQGHAETRILMSVSLFGGETHAGYGMSGVDMLTGDVSVYESSSSVGSDLALLREDFYRMVTYLRPREVVVFKVDKSRSGGQVDRMGSYVVELCGGLGALVHDYRDTATTQVYCRREYQNTMLSKVWGSKCATGGLLTPLEVLNLESQPLAASALCSVLQFTYEHGEHLIRSLQPPRWPGKREGKSGALVLNNTSASQLDLVGDAEGKCGVLGAFNKCQTSMGRRLFRQRVLSPSCDVDELRRSYRVQADLMGGGLGEQLQSELRDMSLPDMDRLIRKLCTGRLTPAELWGLSEAVSASLGCVRRHTGLLSTPVSGSTILLEDFVGRVRGTMSSHPGGEDANVTPLLCAGVDVRVDELEREASEAYQGCVGIVEALNRVVGQEHYKLDSSEREGYYVTVTQKRQAEARMLSREEGCLVHPSELERVPGTSSISASVKLTHPRLREYSARHRDARAEAQIRARAVYEALVRDLGSNGELEEELRVLSAQVGMLDFHSNGARLARKHGWVMPEVHSGVAMPEVHDGAWLRASQLRHPLIEHLLSQTGKHEYVPNDIALGAGQASDGMLLYGINASGKSSLMKSIGLAVVMAQAGLYVAASRFEYSPYHSIHTRIVSVDNLYAGKSTFTAEIQELRGILGRADRWSLVLGDELCSGTESVSAIAIVGAGIQRLSHLGCCYVLATHLHELTSERLGILEGVERLRVCHLSVHYDAELQSLVYDRRMQEGPGEALYGLEVCRSLDLDADFMATAADIRRRIAGRGVDLVSRVQSRYHSQVYLDVCELCGTDMACETHHLVPQRLADERGLLESRFHKNARHNLVCVCSGCHKRLHVDGTELRRVQTGKGSILTGVN